MKFQGFIWIVLLKFVNTRFIKTENKTHLSFRLIHINDIHAHFDQVSENVGRCNAENAKNNACYGGIARMKTAVNQIRNLEPRMESIFLNAGDFYQVIIQGVAYSRIKAHAL